jgi:hypothetical protein
MKNNLPTFPRLFPLVTLLGALALAACGDDSGISGIGVVDSGTADSGGGSSRGLSCGASTDCGGVCINTDTDPSNCGTCGNACDPGEACESGACAVSCSVGLTECAGACVDTDNDPENCGTCGTACEADEVCRVGSCALVCPADFDVCDGACVDTASNPEHCGACGDSCAGGTVCSAGKCETTCGKGLDECSGACVDTESNPQHCGGCGAKCDYDNATGACAKGACSMVKDSCDDNFANCDADDDNGCEVSLQDDAENCGACDYRCGIVEACDKGACKVATTLPTTWKITSLGTDDCVANAFQAIGDDRGGIATGRNSYYYIGDDGAGIYSYVDPNDEAVLADADRVGVFSDLGTGQVYSLTAAGTPITGCAMVDGIVKLDAALEPTGSVKALDMSFNACAGGGTRGIFAGIGMVLVHDGANTKEINLSTGAVTDLGAGATLMNAETCEEWAIWGVAERFGGATYMVLRINTGSDVIARRKVSDGTDTTIVDFAALETAVGGSANVSDLCSFSISPARERWVYHAEDTDSVLGVEPGAGDGEEVTGVCPAEFEAPSP